MVSVGGEWRQRIRMVDGGLSFPTPVLTGSGSRVLLSAPKKHRRAPLAGYFNATSCRGSGVLCRPRPGPPARAFAPQGQHSRPMREDASGYPSERPCSSCRAATSHPGNLEAGWCKPGRLFDLAVVLPLAVCLLLFRRDTRRGQSRPANTTTDRYVPASRSTRRPPDGAPDLGRCRWPGATVVCGTRQA